MKYRDHRGTFTDSMDTVQEFATRAKLISYLSKEYGIRIEDGDVSITSYCWDSRIDWDTYVVTVKDLGVVGYTNGQFT